MSMLFFSANIDIENFLAISLPTFIANSDYDRYLSFDSYSKIFIGDFSVMVG